MGVGRRRWWLCEQCTWFTFLVGAMLTSEQRGVCRGLMEFWRNELDTKGLKYRVKNVGMFGTSCIPFLNGSQPRNYSQMYGRGHTSTPFPICTRFSSILFATLAASCSHIPCQISFSQVSKKTHFELLDNRLHDPSYFRVQGQDIHRSLSGRV